MVRLNNRKRITILLVALIVGLAMIAVPTKAAYAGEDSTEVVKYSKKMTLAVYESATPYIIDMGKLGKIKSIKSSKSSVLKVGKKSVVTAMKAGTAKLTIKVKKKKKTKTYKATVTVISVANENSPIQSFLFGDKEIASLFGKDLWVFYEDYDYSMSSARVQITTPPGWEVKPIRYEWYCDDDDVPGGYVDVKNGSTIQLHNEMRYIDDYGDDGEYLGPVPYPIYEQTLYITLYNKSLNYELDYNVILGE